MKNFSKKTTILSLAVLTAALSFSATATLVYAEQPLNLNRVVDSSIFAAKTNTSKKDSQQKNKPVKKVPVKKGKANPTAKKNKNGKVLGYSVSPLIFVNCAMPDRKTIKAEKTLCDKVNAFWATNKPSHGGGNSNSGGGSNNNNNNNSNNNSNNNNNSGNQTPTPTPTVIPTLTPTPTPSLMLTDIPANETHLQVSYYTIPSGGNALEIIKGSDGNLWFTIDRTGIRIYDINHNVENPVIGSIGRITPEGIVTEFEIPGAVYNYVNSMPGDHSFAIANGSDGNIWFTEAEANKIGKITPQGIITEYSLPAGVTWPRSITGGSDGNLWFIAQNAQGSQMLSMNTSGSVVNQFALPGFGVGTTMTTGPDGNIWYGGAGYFNVGRATLSGTVTEFGTPGRPVNIISGDNNDLWFAQNGEHLSRITTSGIITNYGIYGNQAWVLTKASDGSIWYRDSFSKKINKIGSDGVGGIAYFLTLTEQAIYTGDMVFGVDGNIWFVDSGRIGRIQRLSSVIPTPTVTSIDILPCGSTSCGGITTIKVTGTGFTANTRVELVGSGVLGSYVGGDSSTKILTDFINVPAGTYNVRIYSTNGDIQEVIKPSAITL